MIQRKDILSIPYLKKAKFTGSYQGMRYRLEKIEVETEPPIEKAEGKSETRLKASLWEGPYNYDVTLEEKKEVEEFPFSEEGIVMVVDWLNEVFKREPERWQQAKNNW